MGLEGKVIGILGASSGIGEGAARAIATQNPRGLILAARRKDFLDNLAEELRLEYGTSIMTISTDATNPDELKKFVDESVKAYGKIDAVINSAGLIQEERHLEEMPGNEIDLIINTNLGQVLKLGSYLIPHFLTQRSGIYLVISSQAGQKQNAFPNEEIYNSTKAGVDHAIRTLDKRFSRLRNESNQEIYTFSLAPGFVDTKEARKQFPNIPEEIWKRAPSPLKLATENIIPYLTSPEKMSLKGEKISEDFHDPVHLIETVKF
ncbi:hypothetical protein COU60_02925 [Candidatus Pacearchaeota archaeon CG10_big_fil_rev_8_21_14_0_10_34_76]|nr:MAG: hypothetical protein COU60_02925 [Candidatus Pacearchaeota archaeon CG10_big_fil_rev_8_21_14_0_10_34_76]